jgi:UDP-N-acetylmuramate dehydrogenase
MAPATARAAEILRGSAGERVRVDFPLAPLTTFRIGGPAAVYFEPESEQDLMAASEALAETDIVFAVIGKGSNLLVSDRGFEGMVLRLGRGFRWASRDGTKLRVGGAMPLPALAGTALHHRLSGLEFAVAIPATLGGAVRMNAGAHARSMADVVEKVDVFSLLAGNRRWLAAAEIRFSYRRSNLGADAIVVGATVALEEAPAEQIRAAMESAREWRRETQPLAEPNCGSVFKNPVDGHAARLVEEAGGKGMRVGGASVSTRHANFIVADPGTKAQDVLDLIRAVQALVADRSGVRLETEVHLLGGFDDGGR